MNKNYRNLKENNKNDKTTFPKLYKSLYKDKKIKYIIKTHHKKTFKYYKKNKP